MTTRYPKLISSDDSINIAELGDDIDLTGGAPVEQVRVFATLDTQSIDATGDGTLVDVVFDDVKVNFLSGYDNTTGVFTSGQVADYFVIAQITLQGLDNNHEFGEIQFQGDVNTLQRNVFNPGIMLTDDTTSPNNSITQTLSGIVRLGQGDSVKVQVMVNGGTKTVDLQSSDNGFFTALSIYRLRSGEDPDVNFPITETQGGTNQTTYTAGDILFSPSADTLAKRAIGDPNQVLTVVSGLPQWADAQGGGGGATPITNYWKASDFDVTETDFASLFQDDGTNVKQLVRAFDDTDEEFVNFSFSTATIDTTASVTFKVFMYAATAATANVQLRFGHVSRSNNESWDVAYTNVDSGDIALSSTQDQVTIASWTETIATLGWSADELVIARLSRIAASASDLTGDLRIIGFEITVPQAAS